MHIDPFWPRVGDGRPWAPFQPEPWPPYPYVKPYITVTKTATTAEEEKDQDVEVVDVDARTKRLVKAVNFLIDILVDDESGNWQEDIFYWENRPEMRKNWIERLNLKDGDLDI